MRSPAVPQALLALGALALAGCALPLLLDAPPQLADCPAPLVSTADLKGGDFRLRQQVRYTGRDVDAAFDLAIEKRSDRLVVVGLNAFGARVFSLVQRGLDVESRTVHARAMAVPPENVLRDLHAARFADAGAPPRVEVARPGCGYSATFVTVERVAP